MAGLRLGWYAGDPDIVGYLREVRKHAGLMVPGPVQKAGVAALQDQSHVDVQRDRYWQRITRAAEVLKDVGVPVELPLGGFYLWAAVPGGDDWAWTQEMAVRAGVLVSPGSFYGPGGSGYARLAMVAGIDDIEEMARRLGVG